MAAHDPVCSYATDHGKRRDLTAQCVALATLCRTLKYTLNSIGSIARDHRVPGTSTDQGVFTSCIRGLLEWHDSLPQSVAYRPISASDITTDNNVAVALSRTALHMIYNTAVLCLYRLRFKSVLNAPKESFAESELCRVFMQHAAKQISHISSNIHEHRLGCFLPSMAINVAISAASVHILEMKGQPRADDFTAHESYAQCMKMMQSMEEKYVGADQASAAVKSEFADMPELAHASSPRSTMNLESPQEVDNGVLDGVLRTSETGELAFSPGWDE